MSTIASSGTTLGRLLGHFSTNRTVARKARATVINEPGINGSALVGVLAKARGSVMASITNAAHSVIRRAIAVNGIALHLTSATNLHRASSAIRDVNIRQTGEGVTTTGLVVTIFSSSYILSSRSERVFSLYSNGDYLTIVGGASLRPGVSRSRVGHGFRGMICVSTGSGSKLSLLHRAVRGVLNATGFSAATTLLVGRERLSYYRGTCSTLYRTRGTRGANIAESTVRIYVSSTVRGLVILANRGTARDIMGRVFSRFYMNG